VTCPNENEDIYAAETHGEAWLEENQLACTHHAKPATEIAVI